MKTDGPIKAIFVVCLVVATFHSGWSQDPIIYTQAFTHKLEKCGLEFYQPTENWLRPTPLIEDEYLEYDLVLAGDDGYEMRIIINEDSKKVSQHPPVHLNRIISNAATNSETALIGIRPFNDHLAKEHFNAEWGVIADFTPKELFSSGYAKARIVCFFKSGRALVTYIILYNEEVDRYFDNAMAFRDIDISLN